MKFSVQKCFDRLRSKSHRGYFLLSLLLILFKIGSAQPKTYCNPLNIDYAYCAIPGFIEGGKHRTSADPLVVLFREKYFLFSTNQYGYWWSSDFVDWKFVPRSFLKPYHHVYDDLCAPAAVALGDTLLLLGSTNNKSFPLWMSTNPTVDDWHEVVDSFQVGAWDPCLFLDDNGRLFIYFGSSNDHPIYGQEIDRATFQPISDRKELITLHDDIHGWERFGEHNDNTFLRPFIEGAWMNKHGGKYYLQYAAPGTEFSGYADGVYVGDRPLGPFTYQSHNPFSYKLGGFVRGAGHGATFQDKGGNWWHVATIAVAVKNNFERRIGLWPAGFDKDDVLFCNTAYGDYPHYGPDVTIDDRTNRFTGWMLLNFGKPVTVSTTYNSCVPNFAVDEDIKTYWSAATGDSSEWLQSDLGMECTVHAIQVNYADQNSQLVGKQRNVCHQYVIYQSIDGKKWDIVVDKGNNNRDVPHDYVELKMPVRARYLKIKNVHVPTGKFALSGFRIFGKADSVPPDTVKGFEILRGDSERRNAWIKWQQSENATGYTVYFGPAPEQLYNNILVYTSNEYFLTGLNKNTAYYFQIEAFNESGIAKRTHVVKVD